MLAFGACSWELDDLPLPHFVSCLMLADKGPCYDARTKRDKDNTNREVDGPHDPIEGERDTGNHEHRHDEEVTPNHQHPYSKSQRHLAQRLSLPTEFIK